MQRPYIKIQGNRKNTLFLGGLGFSGRNGRERFEEQEDQLGKVIDYMPTL